MPIDTGFILAAGFGTRMGKIGKQLPKVLWPVFDSTLLGLQIFFLKELGISKIYINAHHHKEQVIEHCKNYYPDVIVLIEDEILDAGGGVHNFINKSSVNNPFLVLNSDQFFATDKKSIKSKLVLPLGHRAKIFTMKGNIAYSSIESNANGKMIGISNKDQGQMFIGLSIVNPRNLTRSLGQSKFFETVCDYKNEEILVESIDGEFLDFGEFKKYHQSCFKLYNYLMNQKHILDSWHESQMIDKEKMINSSYNTNLKRVLNFSNQKISNQYSSNSIILKETREKISVVESSIVYDGMIEKIN